MSGFFTSEVQQKSYKYTEGVKLVLIVWKCVFEFQLCNKWVTKGPTQAKTVLACMHGGLSTATSHIGQGSLGGKTLARPVRKMSKIQIINSFLHPPIYYLSSSPTNCSSPFPLFQHPTSSSSSLSLLGAPSHVCQQWGGQDGYFFTRRSCSSAAHLWTPLKIARFALQLA